MIRKILLTSAALTLAAAFAATDIRAENEKQADANDRNVAERTVDGAERTVEGAARKTDDAGTTAVIKTKLLADQSTSGLEINVSTKNGVVSLDGDVDSAAERAAAEKIAKGTNGVTEVKNNLTVSPD